MNIQYQNNQTGGAFDITTLVTAAKWSTKRTGTPAKLELTVLGGTGVAWVEGGIITYIDGDRRLFYGYLFKITQNEENQVVLLAYDQTRYLKNASTYVFAGIRADQILSQIADDFRLTVGELPSTGYVIPSLVADIKPLIDTVLEALDRTLINAGRMFYLWDDFGKLRLSEVAMPADLPVVGEGSLATGFNYTSSIDDKTYNQVKLVRDNKSSGKRNVYIARDSNNMKLWGVLQLHEKVDENLNEAQVQQRCTQMLGLYNRPQRSLSMSALELVGLRAGQVIYTPLPSIGVNQTFLVEEATHDMVGQTMDLKVKVI